MARASVAAWYVGRPDPAPYEHRPALDVDPTPAPAPAALWHGGQRVERPESGRPAASSRPRERDNLSHPEVGPVSPGERADWARWLRAASCAVARSLAREGQGARVVAPWSYESQGGAFAEQQTATWTPGSGWTVDGAPAPVASTPLPSRLDTVGISRQVSVITRHSPALVSGSLEPLAEVTAAYRYAMADVCDARARHAREVPSRRWWRSRAEGWRARWRSAAECGTRSAWVASCSGCMTDRGPVLLRCGLARECPTCRGAELGRRVDRVERLMSNAERRTVRERARHGPTVAHPLGQWSWKFVSLTIPPGAGVHSDARDVRKAWAEVVRRLDDWLRTEGGESSGVLQLSSVEGTPGESRHGHVHLHALVLAPYLPRGLIRRWWGDALVKRHARRAMPYVGPAEAAEGIRHAPTARLVTHTRRGAAGRELARIPSPNTDIRAADPTSVRELCKYAVKGIELPTPAQLSAWADVYCSLSTVRLFASSRRLASESAIPSPLASMHCEACGLVGQWSGRTERQRGPPEGARVVQCRAIIGSVAGPLPANA